jgi:hypothetical protein
VDQFRIVLGNFKYVPVRAGRALRFDFTWEYDQPGLHLAATSEGCLAYARDGEVTWHYNKTHVRGAFLQTQMPNPELADWVRARLEESGVMKELIADDKLKVEARDVIVGAQPPNVEIREEISHAD